MRIGRTQASGNHEAVYACASLADWLARGSQTPSLTAGVARRGEGGLCDTIHTAVAAESAHARDASAETCAARAVIANTASFFRLASENTTSTHGTEHTIVRAIPTPWFVAGFWRLARRGVLVLAVFSPHPVPAPSRRSCGTTSRVRVIYSLPPNAFLHGSVCWSRVVTCLTFYVSFVQRRAYGAAGRKHPRPRGLPAGSAVALELRRAPSLPGLPPPRHLFGDGESVQPRRFSARFCWGRVGVERMQK